MSTFPEQVPRNPEEAPSGDPAQSPASDPLGPENTPIPPGEWTGEPEEPTPQPGTTESSVALITPGEQRNEPLFASYTLPPPTPREERIPHFGHLGLLFLLAIFGWLGAGLLILFALQIHLWGITKLAQAATDFRYTLASQTAQYILTFVSGLVLFPLVWHKSFFAGVHWHGRHAIDRAGRLFSAAIVCFFIAIINGFLMPGPTNAPIDQLFKSPGAAWVLFAFGITLAPFFEEMAFRGFLLPAFCTAYDWSMEQLKSAPRRPLDLEGNPQWSLTAMIVGSVLTSIPFAVMHGAQTGWSLGPFLLLIFVSLVLCWVRLATRSLAASTLVHASYNFMLFAFMLLGTSGFKHLDRM